MHSMNHLAGPHAFWEYALVACAVVMLIWVLYLGVKFTFWPGEDEPDHIKRKVLEDQDAAGWKDEPQRNR